MSKKEIPVYIFTGFLEAGKTEFIQESLESDEFNNSDERTLLLCCEEGIIEYDIKKYPNKNVFIEKIDDPNQITEKSLLNLQEKYNPTRVIVEFNGMWLLKDFFDVLPENWILVQVMTFVYSPTFLAYNQNMRNLVFDKLQYTQTVVFNRFDKSFDKMEFHKIVRVANSRTPIFYEYEKQNVEIDDIKDPLPFDDSADVIDLKDEFYAFWYRDINEEQDKYENKTIKFKGRALVGDKLPKGYIVFGRQIMTCCVEDIQFCGLICEMPESEIKNIKHGDWYELTARINNEQNDAYGEVGPVLHKIEIKKCKAPQEEVATF